jgi:hypothetical protein
LEVIGQLHVTAASSSVTEPLVLIEYYTERTIEQVWSLEKRNI